MDADKLKEMVMILASQPDGMVPIAVIGAKDQLKVLLIKLGLEFLTIRESQLEELRKELDPEASGFV